VPIARYFMVVGSALVVLLLITAWSLPEPPPKFSGRPEIIERAAIRIKSEHKWPDKAVLDTTQPTFSPSSFEMMLNQQSDDALPDEIVDQANPETAAQPNPSVYPTAAHRVPARAKHRIRSRALAREARLPKRHEQAALGTGEECCRFDWKSRRVTSIDASRRRVARREWWAGWHLSKAN
jgi:hypothetical protein